MNLSDLIRRWQAGMAGLSAIEFALIAPVLLCVYFGSIEASTMMITERKLANAAATVGDLTAREADLTSGDMTDIMNAGILSVSGMVARTGSTRVDAASRTRIRVTSIEWDESGTQTRVGWSQSTSNWTTHIQGEYIEAPQGLVPTDGSILLTEVEYDYGSITGLFDPGSAMPVDVSRTLASETYTRPRRTQIIPIS